MAMGCIYALVGLAFVLIYNASGGLNFSQGEFVMLGAFVLYTTTAMPIPYWLAVVITIAAVGLLGWVFQKLLFYPLKDRSFLYFVIATIGFSILVRNLALIIWGPNPLKVPALTSADSIRFGSVVLSPENVAIIVVTAVLLLAQYLLFFHTDLGRRLRATAQNPQMAQLLGIYPRRMIGITFIMSGAIAGVAGVLLAPIFLIDTDMGAAVLLKAFIAVVIGGFGSIPGVVIGGIAVGLIEILTAVYISSVYKDAICIAVLIVFLVAFPRGLLGEAIKERG
ncbi:branched-chain amino acid ABC transporter permease [Rhodopseudomonas sp. NSM]|uniref:branched-chain amino acid ABC transporter permease n=1 Tax=Rhodopseudomonas sp. NSM TaxID=3457630 RepID=UPI0040356CE2